MKRALRPAVVLIAAALAIWFGVQIYRAGSDVPPPAGGSPETKLSRGHAEGRRLEKPSWSLDYDAITTSPDGSFATLENVHDGELFRNGKPFMRMRAKHVVVNTVSNDFTCTGPVDFTENDGRHDRRFRSDAAVYAGVTQILTLTRPATIVSDGATLEVASATVNFRTGETRLGRIVGTF